VPVVTCRLVPKEVVRCVPVTTCRLEPYCVTYKVVRRIPICVPECVPHPFLGPSSRETTPPPALEGAEVRPVGS
jgi:hypothetical protein